MNFDLIKGRLQLTFTKVLEAAVTQEKNEPNKNEFKEYNQITGIIEDSFNLSLFKDFSDLQTQIHEFIDERHVYSKEEQRLKLSKIANFFEKILQMKKNDLVYFFNNLFFFVNGNFKNVSKDFYYLFNLSNLQVLAVLDILTDFQEIMDAPLKYFQEKKEVVSKNFQGNMLSVHYEILKKVKEGQITTTDLFRLADMDGNGYIGMEEFKILAKRLGMPLTEHRTNEIFTSVLEKNSQSQLEMKLNEKDFEIAFNYLQAQSISLTLEYLGINSEILTLILIWLIILLLIIFAFIFVGIEAFALGGSFGAVINSLFPIGCFYFFLILTIILKVGGAGLYTSSSEGKKVQDEKEMENAVEKSVKMVQSAQVE